MKTITDNATRKKLLDQTRTAAFIQLAFWSTCFAIEHLLGDNSEIVPRLVQTGRNYTEKKLTYSDVTEIIYGRHAKNLNRRFAKPRKAYLLKRFGKEKRLKLLRATQNAVWLLHSFYIEAESIADLMDVEVETVVDFLSEMSLEVDLSLDLTEADLEPFLKGPFAANPTTLAPSNGGFVH